MSLTIWPASTSSLVMYSLARGLISPLSSCNCHWASTGIGYIFVIMLWSKLRMDHTLPHNTHFSAGWYQRAATGNVFLKTGKPPGVFCFVFNTHTLQKKCLCHFFPPNFKVMFWTGIVFSAVRTNVNLLFMFQAGFDKLIVINQDSFMQIKLAWRIIFNCVYSFYLYSWLAV